MVMGALAAMIERRMWEGESLCCYAARSEAAKPEREDGNGNENVKEKKKECAWNQHWTEREEGGEWVVWSYNEWTNQSRSVLSKYVFSFFFCFLFTFIYLVFIITTTCLLIKKT
jgi:Ca2+-dependent lipid-binding protein